jgi:hypothetical protein
LDGTDNTEPISAEKRLVVSSDLAGKIPGQDTQGNASQAIDRNRSRPLMNYPNIQPPQINLARRRFEAPFFVDMESFFEFSFWISEELLDLEALHKIKTRKIRDFSQIPASVLNRSKSIV